MANMARGKYGKDHPDNFIEGALTGGHGPSEGMHHMKVDRKSQSINTPVAMDNVKLALHIETSIVDDDGHPFHGSTTNLKHSVEGASAPRDGDVGAAGPVRHDIIPNH
jgi:hypothetical protein